MSSFTFTSLYSVFVESLESLPFDQLMSIQGWLQVMALVVPLDRLHLDIRYYTDVAAFSPISATRDAEFTVLVCLLE